MKLSEFESLVQSFTSAEMVVFFSHYVKAMRARGLANEMHNIVGQSANIQTVVVSAPKDPFVAQVHSAIESVLRQSRTCAGFLSVFRGNEHDRLSSKLFITLYKHRSDPSRACATDRCRLNKLLAELGFDLYVYAQTINKGRNHTSSTIYWLGKIPR